MKIVSWVDSDGYKRRSLLRDDDPEELAQSGIPRDPPDLSRLDWDGIVKDLHNKLCELGLYDWQDVQRSQNGVTQAILSVLKRPIIGLYREPTPQEFTHDDE